MEEEEREDTDIDSCFRVAWIHHNKATLFFFLKEGKLCESFVSIQHHLRYLKIPTDYWATNDSTFVFVYLKWSACCCPAWHKWTVTDCQQPLKYMSLEITEGTKALREKWDLLFAPQHRRTRTEKWKHAGNGQRRTPAYLFPSLFFTQSRARLSVTCWVNSFI